ncbi:hypothetical protein [Sphingorhabdus sp.]|uniref:hypothetical protein n=1 Tax=Sphingorhabdus sp. TaxID=1902408 RepID=UPI002FDE8D7B
MNKQSPHPLMGILAELLATGPGQHMARRMLQAQTAAGDFGQDMLEAPERIGEAAQSVAQFDDSDPNAVGAAALEAGLMGGFSRAVTPHGATRGPGPVGPGRGDIPADAAIWTDKHRQVGIEELRKMLAGSGTGNSRILTENVQAALQKKGFLNVPPQEQIRRQASGSMKRIDPEMDLTRPGEIERNIQMATGWRRGGTPTTLAIGGATLADDEQRAQVADIIRRVKAGEI